MSIKLPRQVLGIFFLMSFFVAPIYAQKDPRVALYRQIEGLCNKNSTLKMSKKKVSQICKCIVDEHKDKDLGLEAVQTLHKRYSMSKAKLKIEKEDIDVIAAYDDDTVYDCIEKYK